MTKLGQRIILALIILISVALSWYSPEWGYRKQVVIDGSKFSEDVSNYSMSISVPMSELNWKAKHDFGDVIFVWYDTDTGSEYSVPQTIVSIDYPANWLYYAWKFRIPINISNPSNENLYDVQIALNISYIEGMNIDFSDLRFSWYNYSSGNEEGIPFWIERKENGNYAKVWVKVPYIGSNENATLFMYFGNEDENYTGNPDEVFVFFSDFENESLPEWSIIATSSTSSIEVVNYTSYHGEKSLHLSQALADGDTFIVKDLGAGYTDYEAIMHFYDNVTKSGIIGFFVMDDTGAFPGVVVGINTDLNNTHYAYRIGDYWYVTNVSRTSGWHEFKVYTNGTVTKIFIDNIPVAEITDGIQNIRYIRYGTMWHADEGFFADLVYVKKFSNRIETYFGEIERTNSSATFYVKVPIIRAGSSTSIFMYYGNPSVTPYWYTPDLFSEVYIQSGTLDVSDFDWHYVQFNTEFKTVPYVFATVEFEGSHPNVISVRVYNITGKGFYVRAEAFEGQPYAIPKRIHWMAVGAADYYGEDITIKVDKVTAGGNYDLYRFDVNVEYSEPIMHQIQTMNVPISGMRSRVAFEQSPPAFRIEECNEYTGSGTEDIALASITSGLHWVGDGVIYATKVYINDEDFGRVVYPIEITNPVVLTYIDTLYGPQPALSHVENATTTETYVSLEEPPCLDGSHAYEYVAVIVTNVTYFEAVFADVFVSYLFGSEETASNVLPKIHTMYLSPEQPKTADDITCYISTTGSPDIINFKWYVNGVVVRDFNTTDLFDTLWSSYFTKHDNVSCVASVYLSNDIVDSRSVSVTIRNTPPTDPQYLSPDAGIFGGTRNIVNVTCSGSYDADSDSITYKIYAIYDGSTHYLGSVPEGDWLEWNVSGIKSQTNVDVYCIAHDGEDNSNIFNPPGTITIDNTKPVTYTDFDSSLWYNTPQTIYLYCDDNIQCNETLYCVDTTNTCDPSLTYTGSIYLPDEGVHYIRSYSIDEVGNRGDLYVVTVRIDYTPPNITVFEPNDTKYTDFIPINISVTDNYFVSRCWAEYAGTVIEIPECKNVTLYGPQGVSTLYIYAEDAAGNVMVFNKTIELEATRISTGGGGGGLAGATYISVYVKVPFIPKVPTYVCFGSTKCVKVDENKGIEKFELTVGEYKKLYLNVSYGGKFYVIKPYSKFGFKTSILIDVGKELGLRDALYKQKAIMPKNEPRFPSPAIMLGMATLLIVLSYVLRPL